MIEEKLGTFKYNKNTSRKRKKPDTSGQLKTLHTNLAQVEKMASLGQMAAGIAHDIKNPLSLLLNFSDLSNERIKELRNEFHAEKDVLPPDKVIIIANLLDCLEQNLHKIKEHGNRVDSLVKRILLHFQGKEGEFEWVDLHRLLEENINLAFHSMRVLDRSFDVKIETHFDNSIGKVKLVSQEFGRAFLNIVNNACFAANEKRKAAAPEFSPSISIETRTLGENIEIRIRDNGNGIPGKNRKLLFTPFFTTKPGGKGIGLGLAIAYEIITGQHKGTIDFNSREGEYTEFIITIPTN